MVQLILGDAVLTKWFENGAAQFMMLTDYNCK